MLYVSQPKTINFYNKFILQRLLSYNNLTSYLFFKLCKQTSIFVYKIICYDAGINNLSCTYDI